MFLHNRIAASMLTEGLHYRKLRVLARMIFFRCEDPVRMPAVIGHFALARAEGRADQPGFEELLALVRRGKAYVKLSGPYRISKRSPDYDDIAPITRALVRAAPDRMLWGSNWPHTSGANRRTDQDPSVIEPFRFEDDGRNFNLVADWVPEAGLRSAILVDNPARAYGFTG